MVSGITDYLDGKIARRFGLVSRIGQLLDPLADRLYILATLLGLAYRGVIPWWLVGILVAPRALRHRAAARGPPHGYAALPVHFIGKAATFNLLYAFPLLLLGQISTTAGHRGPAGRAGRSPGGGPACTGWPGSCTPCRSATWSAPRQAERTAGPMSAPAAGRPAPRRRPDASMTLLTEMMQRPLDPGYAAAAGKRKAAGRRRPPATAAPCWSSRRS